jgi:hypothetical protein
MKKKPTCIKRNGDKWWFLDGLIHREDGPAIEYTDGTKLWYLNGKPHRENGPAVEWPDGSKSWYLYDIYYKEEAYWKELFNLGLITEKELFLKLL